MERWTAQAPPPLPEGLYLPEFFGSSPWHQRWEIFDGIFTPGRNPVNEICTRIGLPGDLRGQRVLDVGAWHGCFSFECERRGAEEVVALSLEPPGKNGFLVLKNQLGSRVQYVQRSVYEIDQETLGQFDLILFVGVLYHLRYPLLALDRLRTVCRGQVLIESHVIDNHMRLPGSRPTTLSRINKKLANIPLWRFYPGNELNDDPSNWFGPNCRAVIDAFDSAGFQTRLLAQWDDRAAFAASVAAPLEQSLRGAYESWTANRSAEPVEADAETK